jgi:hypothetical protein
VKSFRTVLAVPHAELNSPFVGLLRPVFDLRAGETFKSDPRDYPNRGLVFTPSLFDEICDATPRGTVVQLQIEENLASSLAPTDPNFAKYIVCKNGWGEAERWAVQLVIDHPFDKSNRTIHLKESPRHPIWLRDPNTRRLYGPFDTTARKLATGGVAIDLQPPDAIPFAPSRDEHAIASISMHAVELEEIDGVEYLAFTRAEFAKKTVEWIDFSTDEALLNMVRELASTSTPLTLAQIEHLRSLLSISMNAGSPLTNERVKRAAALLDSAAGWQEHRHTLIEEYFATGRGAEHVERYLQTNRDDLVDQAFHKHYAYVLERVQEHTLNLTNLAIQIKARKDELDALQNVDTGALTAKREELESQLEGHRNELDLLKAQLNAGHAILDVQMELEHHAQALDAAKVELETLKREHDELEQVRDRLRAEAERDLNDLRSRLTSIKPYVDTLTGASIKQHVKTEVKEPTPAVEAPASLPALVDKMHESLLAANHRIAKRDVANVFSGILTSPLTILAGLPGVGKTSLVTRLAEILGMANGSQFLTVRVPRGWRGRQDILGYHNPITGEYERAPTGIYAMLEWHQRTKLEVPAWLLFDEANLSAPEHYLSDFLGMMDEVADRNLATGAPGEVFQVPDHLRFVFTINQDHSVEALTPRVLDRAAVVYVPPPDSFEAASTYSSATKHSTGTLTMDQLRKLLDDVPSDLNASEDATLKKVVKVLHDNNPRMGIPTRISPRKHRRVQKHTTTMRHILGVNAGLDALDHAVATHVLSLVRGSGKTYRARLDALAREIESLPVSAGLLQRIIVAGEAAFDEYHFQTLA